MVILGLDSSTSVTGWAFSKDGKVLDAGYIDTKKLETTKEKTFFVISELEKNPLIKDVTTINCKRTSGKYASDVIDATVRIRSRSASIGRSAITSGGTRSDSDPLCRATADGTITTRAPVECTRQQRSTSSPTRVNSGRNPPMTRNKSARISSAAVLRTNTSCTWSCCS